MIARVFAVLAAAFIIGAFALATLGPPQMTLRQGIIAMDRVVLTSIEQAAHGGFWQWPWERLISPILSRPAWLFPAALGLVAAGAAATIGSARASPSRRRRS